MADKAPVQAIVEALAEALRGITVANGYRTDIGAHVHTERSEVGIPTVQRCTVVPLGKLRGEEGDRNPGRGRRLEGVIEVTVPASYANAMATVIAAEEDIDTCLARYHQMPNALPVQYDEAEFADRPGLASGWSAVWLFTERSDVLSFYLESNLGFAVRDDTEDTAVALASRTEEIARRFAYLFE